MDQYTVTICADCAVVSENGTDGDPGLIAHFDAMDAYVYTNFCESGQRYSISVSHPEYPFAKTPCETCGSDLAGERWTAILWCE